MSIAGKGAEQRVDRGRGRIPRRNVVVLAALAGALVLLVTFGAYWINIHFARTCMTDQPVRIASPSPSVAESFSFPRTQ
jgi:hypothetical protein